LGEVQAGSFRAAVRFFLVELSRTNHCGKNSTLVGPGQLRQKEAHHQTESSCLYFTEFLAAKIKGLA